MRKQRKARRRLTVKFVEYLYQIVNNPRGSRRLRMRAGEQIFNRFGLPIDSEADALRREVHTMVRTAVRNAMDRMVRAELAALIGGRS